MVRTLPTINVYSKKGGKQGEGKKNLPTTIKKWMSERGQVTNHKYRIGGGGKTSA